MQKTIRVLAIIATLLVVLSMILLAGSTLFQRVIAKGSDVSAEVMSMLPMFPLLPFLQWLLEAGCIALLIICCGNKRGGIWLEILVLVALIVIKPVIFEIAQVSRAVYLGRLGDDKVAADAFVSNISRFCTKPGSWGHALACIVSGMSIAFKVMSKKQAAEEETQQ